MGVAEDREAVRVGFRKLLSADRGKGEIRSLHEYKGLFPGFGDIVEEEHARRPTPDPSPQDRPTAVQGGPRMVVAREDPAPAEVPSGRGDRLGPYRIQSELGRGGMGIVYEAQDTRLPRRVALKVLSPQLACSMNLRLRFEREAAIAAKLDHPNLCTVYEAGEADGAPFMAMQFVEGRPLSDLIAQSREAGSAGGSVAAVRLPAGGGEPAPDPEPARTASAEGRLALDRVLVLFEKTARALHAAHERGLIHRDVKPSNIMVRPDGEPVLLDFGLAREEDGEGHDLTRTGALLGTPAYLSPEQLAAQRIRLDRRTDVYSLGVSLYECLTLHLPFEAPTTDALYQRILTSSPADPRKWNAWITGDLRVVLDTSLEKDRDRRFQTAQDFAEDLRRIRAKEPIRARPVPVVVRTARWVQRNRALAASLAGVFLLLSGGLVNQAAMLRRIQGALTEAETERTAKAAAASEAQEKGRQALESLAREREERKAKEEAYRTLQEDRALLVSALKARDIEGPFKVVHEGLFVRIEPREGGLLRHLGQRETDGRSASAPVERLFLAAGPADIQADLDFELLTPAFRLERAPGSSGRASVYVETLAPNEAYARVLAGSAPVVLLEVESKVRVRLEAGQGITMRRPMLPGSPLGLTTDFHNEREAVRVEVPSRGDLSMRLEVPKATRCGIEFGTSGGKAEIENDAASWRSAKIRCTALRGEKTTAEGEIAPGTVARVEGEFGRFDYDVTRSDPEGARGDGIGRSAVGGGRPVAPGRSKEEFDWEGASTQTDAPAPLRAQGSGSTDVVVERFERNFEVFPPRVEMTLRNRGEPIEAATVTVEFGFRTPPQSLALYDSVLVTVDLVDFKSGEPRTVVVECDPGSRGAKAGFARLCDMQEAHSTGTTARGEGRDGLRRGDLLLGGRLEVVEVEADLVSPKPRLRYTLEVVEGPAPLDLSGLRYRVSFVKGGSLVPTGRRFGAFRPVTATTGNSPNRIVIDVSGLDGVEDVAGAAAVLHLRR